MAKKENMKCDKEAEIAAMAVTLDDLKKIIKDNGQPGLASTVGRLVATTNSLSIVTASLETTVDQINATIIKESGAKSVRRFILSYIPPLLMIILSVLMYLTGTGVLKGNTQDVRVSYYEFVDGKAVIHLRDGREIRNIDSINYTKPKK